MENKYHFTSKLFHDRYKLRSSLYLPELVGMSLNDFYNTINKQWLKSHKIPSDDISYSIFDQVEEKIKNDMIDIIHKERKRDTPLGSFIESFYTGRRQDLDIVKGFVDHILSQKTISAKIGLMNLYGLDSPVIISVSYDQRDTDKCIVYIGPPELSIMKVDFKDETSVAKEYKVYLSKLGRILKDPEFSDHVYTLEKRLSTTYHDPKDNGNTDLLYNPMTYTQLISTYTNLDFDEIFGILHIDRQHVNNLVVVTNPQYLSMMNTMIKSHASNYFNFWFTYLIYSSFMEMLPNPFKSLHFDFFISFIRGQTAQHTIDHQIFKLCDSLAQDCLGKRYIEENIEQFKKIRTGASEIYSLVHKAARKRIHKLNWLSEDSRRIAEYKLNKMKSKLAFPEVWLDEFSGVDIDSSCFMMNVFGLSQKQTMYEFSRLSGLTEFDRKMWNNSSYEVNAYYYAELNELCVPMGFLQSPFFSLKQNFVTNLAGLGNVIAHEISHGFDEEGRKFDEHGNSFPWWTANDIQLYTTKTRSLIQEYDKQIVDGVKINGELTLGENLADFGAVAICLDVLKDYWASNSTNSKLQKTDLREFFIAYTKSWAYKNTLEARKLASKSDTHAPPILRVNVVLRHFKEFYDAFDFTSEQEGWIPPEQRIDIWGI